jgi:hypothetical protein
MRIQPILSYGASALSIVYGYQIAIPLLICNVAMAALEKIRECYAQDPFSKELHKRRMWNYVTWAQVSFLRCFPVIGGIAAFALQLSGRIHTDIVTFADITFTVIPDNSRNQNLLERLKIALEPYWVKIHKFEKIKFLLNDDSSLGIRFFERRGKDFYVQKVDGNAQDYDEFIRGKLSDNVHAQIQKIFKKLE